MSEPSITCPVCGATSFNLNDIREGYCGACHDWTGAIGDLRNRGMGAIGSYDKQGVEVTFARWTWLTEHKFDNDYYRIAEDYVDLYRVSTVWIGLDMSFPIGATHQHRPIIFETMVFLAGTAEDTYMNRYATEAEALAGHEAVVAEIRVLSERAADRERINDGEG